MGLEPHQKKFLKKFFDEVPDPFHLPTDRNLKYYFKNGGLKFSGNFWNDYYVQGEAFLGLIDILMALHYGPRVWHLAKNAYPEILYCLSSLFSANEAFF